MHAGILPTHLEEPTAYPVVHTRTKPTGLVYSFTPIGTIALHRTLTHSSYRFNTTDLTFSQYHPQTLKMKSYQNLLPPLYLVSMAVGSILMLHHKAGSPYNSDIHFPIYTKLVSFTKTLHIKTVCNIYSTTYWKQVLNLISINLTLFT